MQPQCSRLSSLQQGPQPAPSLQPPPMNSKMLRHDNRLPPQSRPFQLLCTAAENGSSGHLYLIFSNHLICSIIATARMPLVVVVLWQFTLHERPRPGSHTVFNSMRQYVIVWTTAFSTIFVCLCGLRPPPLIVAANHLLLLFTRLQKMAGRGHWIMKNCATNSRKVSYQLYKCKMQNAKCKMLNQAKYVSKNNANLGHITHNSIYDTIRKRMSSCSRNTSKKWKIGAPL